MEKKIYLKEEEEALLADSDGEGARAEQSGNQDEEMKSDGEEELRRKREAELADMLQMNKGREERMKRRKMEREKLKADLAIKEAALRDVMPSETGSGLKSKLRSKHR